MTHDMPALEKIIEKHSQTESNWTPFSISIVAMEYADHLNNGNDEPVADDRFAELKKNQQRDHE